HRLTKGGYLVDAGSSICHSRYALVNARGERVGVRCMPKWTSLPSAVAKQPQFFPSECAPPLWQTTSRRNDPNCGTPSPLARWAPGRHARKSASEPFLCRCFHNSVGVRFAFT